MNVSGFIADSYDFYQPDPFVLVHVGKNQKDG